MNPQKIRDRFKSGPPENKGIDVIMWSDVFMERYGMSFEDFRSLPIPTFFALADRIKKEQDKMNKQTKSKGRKR